MEALRYLLVGEMYNQKTALSAASRNNETAVSGLYIHVQLLVLVWVHKRTPLNIRQVSLLLKRKRLYFLMDCLSVHASVLFSASGNVSNKLQLSGLHQLS